MILEYCAQASQKLPDIHPAGLPYSAGMEGWKDALLPRSPPVIFIALIFQ
ncbi:hypothetical protein RJO15_03755 [Herbaspirillum huttiense F1]|nr:MULTISPECIES: hypothetical protein [unclassified Herbaspirillum]MCO4856131.1 hypothetical protein [Herbaspirillum sp. WGmk3]MDR6739044.1 hypothetical protein [Herbaspirillum sp. 1173]MDT0354873.1 hypothetical protein [Herbaspirillum huttiense F1]